MKATITHQHNVSSVTAVRLIHENGLQIEITPGPIGFILNPGEQVDIKRFGDHLMWEIIVKKNQES